MKSLKDRLRLSTFAVLAAASLATFALSAGDAAAEERTSIKIGYAVSKTGANAGGAAMTTIPNYKLWLADVAANGGLELPDGTKLPVEVVEYDDRSSAEEVVRAVERLAGQDKVDFILPPWGTGFNLAVAPLFDRYGYPQLAVSSVTDKAPDFVKRWPKSYWFLGGGRDYAGALAKMAAAQTEAGVINSKVAMISVADGFGIDLVNAARPAMKEAGLEIVMDRTYPVGTQDFTTLINEAANSGADTFVAFSYPPDTFALTQQSQVQAFNPKVLYLGVGAGFPTYGRNLGPKADGIMTLGGIDIKNERNMAYRERHKALNGEYPDLWGSVITYASLQMLADSIKRVGLDRDAVAKELSTGTFDTVLGETKLEDNQLRQLWLLGQWQDGNLVGIEPADRPGASKPVLPKKAWQ